MPISFQKINPLDIRLELLDLTDLEDSPIPLMNYLIDIYGLALLIV